MSTLKDYITEQVEDLYKQKKTAVKQDYLDAADSIMEKIIMGDYHPATSPRCITKCESYAQFMKEYGCRIHNIIYSYLVNNPHISRAQIAQRLGLRVSTVCARVNEMLKAGVIHKSGYAIDTDTKRKVEILQTTENE